MSALLELKDNFLVPMKRAIGDFMRIISVHDGHDNLAEERVAYAEIGRIVGIPFSVANVYERFADQVAKIIPFDLICITQTDPARDLVIIKYALGLDAMGMSEGDTFPLKGSVVADVVNAKRATRTDEHPHTGKLAKAVADSGLLSRVATPLIANEQVVGTLHLGSSVPDIYGEAELARLKIVGNLIAGAIASAILLQVESDRAAQLESLYNVAAILALPLDFEAKAQRVVDALVSITDANYVVLRRGGEKQQELRLVASAGPEEIEIQRILKISGENITTLKAYIQGKPILINDYSHYPDAQKNILAKGLKSMYFMPIMSRDRTLGVLATSESGTLS